MKFKGSYPKICNSISGISQVYKVWAICMNIPQPITKVDQFNQVVIRVDICNKIWYHLGNVDQITVGIDIYGIFDIFAFDTDILIQISIWNSPLDVLTIILHGNALNVDQQREFECDFGNNGQSGVTNKFYKIHATPIVIGFFVNGFHFILQAMDTSSLSIALPIEFEEFIVAVVAIGSLILNFAVNTISFHAQGRHSVCAVYISFAFSFVCNFGV